MLNVGEDERGAISDIVEKTELSKATVTEFMNNTAASVKYEVLAEICRYLITEKGVDPTILPGALFEFAADEFWQLLSEQERIEFCMGNRSDPHWYDNLVMAADSQLQSTLIQRITEHGGPHKGSGRRKGSRKRQVFVPQLIAAPSRDEDNEPERIREAAAIWRESFATKKTKKKDKALVCLGSVKSNSVIESFVASCFPKAKPFESEDGVKVARDRACPFAILFRPTDPKINSCCGGQQLCLLDSNNGPGIYYETANQKWAGVPSNHHSDGAIVFYRYNKSLRNLCICLGGYSSQATRWLSEYLRSGQADHAFWPPSYEKSDIQIGLFVIRFTLDQTSKRSEKPSSIDVIPIAEQVIRRRFQTKDDK
jgi:hypothetical protein